MENTLVEMREDELAEVSGGWIHVGLLIAIAAVGVAAVAIGNAVVSGSEDGDEQEAQGPSNASGN